jgi:ABC-type Fe3+ transport system permease subunit
MIHNLVSVVMMLGLFAGCAYFGLSIVENSRQLREILLSGSSARRKIRTSFEVKMGHLACASAIGYLIGYIVARKASNPSAEVLLIPVLFFAVSGYRHFSRAQLGS